MISAPAAYTSAILTNPARIYTVEMNDELTGGSNTIRRVTHRPKNSTPFATAAKTLRLTSIRRSSDPREGRFALSEARFVIEDSDGTATTELSAGWVDGSKCTIYATLRGLDWDAGQYITLFTGIVESFERTEERRYEAVARGVFAEALAVDLWGGAVATLAADMTASQTTAVVTKGQGLEDSGAILLGLEPATYSSRQDNGNGTHTLKGIDRAAPDPSNLFPYPEALDDPVWTRFGATVAADAEQAPDETMTVETIVEDGSTGVHVLSFHPNNSTIPMPANTDFVISFFARPNGRDELAFLAVRRPSPAANALVWFDLNAGTVGTETNGTGAIEAEDDGYRCSVAFNSGEGGLWSTVGFTFFLGVATEDQDYAGDGSSGIDIWGVKVERDVTAATAYVPKSQVTSTAHTAGEDVRQYFPLGLELAPLHITDIVRQLLINPSGPGGVGLPTGWIDEAGFAAAKAAIGDFPVCWINGRNRTNAKRVIEQQGFRVMAGYPVENNLGQVRPALLDRPAPGDFVATLTDADVLETPRLRGTIDRLVSEVRWAYDEDLDTGDLAESFFYRSPSGARSTLAIESVAVRAVALAETYLRGRSQSVTGRYNAPAPVIEGTLHMRSGELLEIGDPVFCTFSNVRNPFAASATVDNAPFTLIEHQFDFRRQTIRVTLLGFPGILESPDPAFVRAHSITGYASQVVA